MTPTSHAWGHHIEFLQSPKKPFVKVGDGEVVKGEAFPVVYNRAAVNV